MQTATMNHVVKSRGALPIPRNPRSFLALTEARSPARLAAVGLALPDSASHLTGLPMPAMSTATVSGERLPILAGMPTQVTVKALKRMLELDTADRLMRVTDKGTAELLGDTDVVDLMERCNLEVVRPNVDS
ncbi:hypothetical protein MYX77_01105 [Acidobacteriia bacterium AH_259_A11_L15]|nr:hypothetical protein [Acidobacteriia bacterium AH_259_A11_L15]